MKTFLKWLFCPHEWEEVKSIDVLGSGKSIIYEKMVLRCKKCTRIKVKRI